MFGCDVPVSLLFPRFIFVICFMHDQMGGSVPALHGLLVDNLPIHRP